MINFKNINDEQWMPVVGAEEMYIVSSKGRVISLSRKLKSHFKNAEHYEKPNKLMIPIHTGSGYYRVRITYQGKVKLKGVHVLVAESFLENPMKLNVVHHINYNTADNRLINLKWTSSSENVIDAFGKELSINNINADTELSLIYTSCRESKLIKKPHPKVDDLPNEIWKEVPNGSGIYHISNIGRIKTVKERYRGGIASKLLVQTLRGKPHNTYYGVSIPLGDVIKQVKIHRLVAQAFIENPMQFPMVNHIDGNRLNNNVENLEWCDQCGNMQHAFNVLKRVSGRFGKPGTHPKPIYCSTLGISFSNIMEAADKLGYSAPYISKACSKNKHVGGLTFRYL